VLISALQRMMIRIGNEMPNLKIILIAALSALMIGAFSSWWVTASYKENKYKAIISEMKLDAAHALADATQKAINIEREHNRLATELEVQNAENRKKLDDVYADNLRLASEYSGLYDRYASASNCPVSPDTSASPKSVTPPSGGRLSDPLAKLLLSESRRADEAAAYAATCYQWINSLKSQ
jgi:hypothetical protein